MSVSWEDRFRQLAEYKQRHGNFDVPLSTAIDGDGDDKVELEENQNRFYRWVSRLHNEHRAFEKGTSSKLNADHIEKLRSIGVPEDVGRGEGDFQEKDGGDRRGGCQRRRGITAAYPYPRIDNIQ